MNWRALKFVALSFVSALLLGAAYASRAFAGDSGEAVYKTTCVACHGANGKGLLPGVPDFTRKDGVLSLSDAVLLQRIKEGHQSPGSPVPMPPKGGNASLTDERLRDVLSYLKHAFAK